ncbi:MAG TPA: TonB-dependent receptor [Opitutaceae bacterium]|nr:TonB-dependent receptor [Opitutaceae bacterium]
MKTYRIIKYSLVALAGPLGGLLAQSVPTAAHDEMVILSPFTISAESTSRYQAVETTSGTRVRVALIDSPQSVSVVTHDLIDDIGAGRVLDAAKYVAGVYESTIPNAQDRTTIRGFQSDGATVDGFTYFSYANIDPVLIDRIEVVKGPNAILAPQGVPGGTINDVSKKPLFSDQGYVSGQVGRYNSDRGEIDVNRVAVAGKLAVRVVAAEQYSKDLSDGNFHHSTVAMPMFTYRIGPASELTLQAQFGNSWAAAYGGLPIDLYTGTNDSAHYIPGISRNLDLYTNAAARHQREQHYRLNFTTAITEHLSMRVAGNYITEYGSSVGISIGNPTGTGLLVKLDPLTGLWSWDGVTHNDNPTFPRSGTINFQNRTYANLQNDFVYEVKNDFVKSSSVVGYAINYNDVADNFVQNFTMPSFDIRNFVFSPYTLTTPNSWTTQVNRDQQIYLNEVASFFNDRVSINGGVSRDWYKINVYDKLRDLHATTKTNATLPSAGIIVKPINNVALYASYSEQSTAIAPSTTSTIAFKTQTSKQYEFGTRVQLLENRLYGTLAYFDIKQNNFSVPNPLNAAVPTPNPLFPPLFMDRKAHGVELEMNYAITKQLSLIGNFTSMRNRDPNGVPFRGNAERSGATWVNYVFDKGSSLKGLTAGIGVDYLSRRPGDSASGFTSASTPSHVIPIQSSFYLPARALVNMSVSYRFGKNWKTQLNIDNLLDKKYLAASTARNTVFPGTPFNPKLTVTYNF